MYAIVVVDDEVPTGNSLGANEILTSDSSPAHVLSEFTVLPLTLRANVCMFILLDSKEDVQALTESLKQVKSENTFLQLENESFRMEFKELNEKYAKLKEDLMKKDEELKQKDEEVSRIQCIQ